MAWNITADSVPVLDGWGWGDYWDVSDWIRWHELRKAKYGRDDANRKLLDAYHSATFGAASNDWKTFNPTFRDYAKANGFYDQLFVGVTNLPRFLVSILDLFRGGSSVVESVGEAGGAVAGATRWLLPVLVLAAVAYLGFFIFRFLKK